MLHPHVRDMFRSDEFDRDTQARDTANALAFDLVLWASVPACVLITLSQVWDGTPACVWAGLGWLVADVCLLAWRYLLHGELGNPTLGLYLLLSFMMFMSVLMGTVLDTGALAFTVFVIFAIYPFAIYDRPPRVLGTYFAWTAVFLALVLVFKVPGIREADFLHAAAFSVMAMTSALVAGALRLDAMRRHRELRHKYEHDAITGLPNHTLMERHLPSLAGEDVCCACIELENRSFYYVMLGDDAGNEIVTSFARRVQECFGTQGHVYQTANDTFMVVARMPMAAAEDWVLSRMRRLEELATQVPVGDGRRGVAFVAGYEVAHADSVGTLHQVLRAAGADCIQAGRQTTSGIAGHRFDPNRDLDMETRLALGRGDGSASSRDPLTGLLNAQAFLANGRQLLASTVESDRSPVAAYVNIVGMKAINARYGFERGDATIQLVAQAMREALPDRLVARSEGDHFVAMIYEDELPALQSALRAVGRDEGDEGLLKAGYCPIEHAHTLAQACDRARVACGRITHRADKDLAAYDQTMGDEALRRHLVLSGLERAIENGWIKLYVQPVVSLETGKVCGAEALCRWDDPKLGFLTPDKFIGVLEEEGRIPRLDRHMAELAVRMLAERRDAGRDLVPVSINLARQDLVEGDVCSYLEGLLDRYGIPREMLVVEVTERDVAESPQMVLAGVERLREHGFEVWMDDFGSEYSSLNMLESCQFDVIKIDMGFMREFVTNPRSHVIVESVVDLVRRLGARTLTEGVETGDQLAFLRGAGCNFAQGYYFSKPVPVGPGGEIAGEELAGERR